MATQSDGDARILPSPATPPDPHPDTAAILLRKQQERARDGAHVAAQARGIPEQPDQLKGLALSGGGIRSATLSLGVLQAIAMTHRDASAPAIAAAGGDGPPQSFKQSLLSDFPYLSTVSGGGYIGSFLCSLFIPGRLSPSPEGTPKAVAAAAAADDAVKVLCNEPPGRVRAVLPNTASPMKQARAPSGRTHDALLQAPLAWLRDNGRYLTPTGNGDAFYAGSLALRNVASIHYVVGAATLAAFAFLALLEAWIGRIDTGWAYAGLASGSLVGGWWVSPIFLLVAAILAIWVIPAGAAFWIPYPGRKNGECSPLNWACAAFLGGVILFAVAGIKWTPALHGGDRILHGLPWWYASAVALIGLLMFLGYRWSTANVNLLRYRATRSLSLGLQIAAGLLAIAAIDSLAHVLYHWMTCGDATGTPGKIATLATPAGAAGALVWVIRKIALTSGPKKSPSWIAKIPLQWIFGIAGVTLLALLATTWALITVVLIWQGQPLDTTANDIWPFAHAAQACGPAVAKWPPHIAATPVPALPAAIVACVGLILSIAFGWFPSFINLSSLQSFYAARLTRAYLGASNGQRFRPADADPGTSRKRAGAAEPLPSDQVSLDAFLSNGQLATHAPLQLINVTMNNTDDPGEQLVQRDRKGQPIVVTPRGFSVDGGSIVTFTSGDTRLELDRTLSLGQWTGISGAAASTGLGRQTSLGLALLLGAANIRLGSWWKSGLGNTALGPADRAVNWVFPTQTYLFDEFTAKFHGLARDYQYLSDGGHFENTAAYELLRPERQVEFILLCDHGADRGYGFEDLANLIRLVRIDMQIDLVVDTGITQDDELKKWFGVPEDFRNVCKCEGANPAARAEPDANGQPRREPVAILLHAKRGHPSATQAWVVVLKPRVRRDSAADVIQYALTHPTFPQETTGDQFFDEAQWESYRKLAFDNASHLLRAEVWAKLRDYMRANTIR
jgi:hypothetical protein